MGNEKYLISFRDQTESEQREKARMGGIASGEARRKKKAFRETVQQIAAMGVPDKVLKKLREQGISKEDATYQTAIVLKMFHEAMSGNVSAFNTLVNVAGEMVNKHELTGKDGQPLQVEKQMTMEEIREKLRELDEE